MRPTLALHVVRKVVPGEVASLAQRHVIVECPFDMLAYGHTYAKVQAEGSSWERFL